MLDLFEHRRGIIENLEKAFGVDFGGTPVGIDEALLPFIEKAYHEGDLMLLDGKMHVYTQYAPGKFDWHVLNPKILAGVH